MSTDYDPDVAAGLRAVAKACAEIVVAERRCCPRCEHFDLLRESCLLAQPPARPPAKIVAFGCAQFQRDSIPF